MTSTADAPARGEFSRGWRILLASFLGAAIGVSSLYFYSLGVFIKPLAHEFGWSRGQASLGALVGTLCAALMAFPIGRLVDRVGSRRVATGSLVLLALGFFTVARLSRGLTSFLVLTAMTSLLAAGSSPLPFTRLVVAAFVRHRGLALGLVLAGTAVGGVLIPAFLPGYVAAHGWRAGYVALGVATLGVTPLVAMLTHAGGDPAPIRTVSPAFANSVAQPAFRLLGAVFWLAAVATLGAVVQFLPMMSDAGLRPAVAGGLASLIGLAAVASRVVSGRLLDVLPTHLVTAAMFAVTGLGVLVLAFGGIAFAAFGAIVLGVSVGSEVDLIAFLVSRYFGADVYGQVYGAMYGLFMVGGAIGPPLSGFLFDATGSYRASLVVAAGLLAAAAILSLAIGRLPRADVPALSRGTA